MDPKPRATVPRRLPPLDALVAFEVAARRLSFLEAANELAITPSALSRRIQVLEARIGVSLFVRGHRSVRLTDEGERYLVQVRTAIEMLREAGASIGVVPQRTIRVQAAAGIAGTWLAQEIVRYQNVDPTIEFVLSGTYSLAALRSGAVDVAIRYGEDDWGRLVRRPLMSEEVVPVAAPVYLARVGPFSAPRDLKRAALLRHPQLSWRRWFAGIGVEGAEPQHGALFDDALVMLEAAAQGAGVALMVASVLERSRIRDQLIRLFPAVPDQAYFVVMSEAASERRWVREFVSWLVRRARGETGFAPI